MIPIPPERLADQILTALIEDFVTREGTDYGFNEVELATKVSQVRKQIDRGLVVIVFDEESESCNLLARQEYEARQQAAGDTFI